MRHLLRRFMGLSAAGIVLAGVMGFTDISQAKPLVQVQATPQSPALEIQSAHLR